VTLEPVCRSQIFPGNKELILESSTGYVLHEKSEGPEKCMQASLFEIRQDIQKDYKEDYRQSLIDWIKSSEIPPVSSSRR